MSDLDKILFDIRAAKELPFGADSTQLLALMERLAIELYNHQHGNGPGTLTTRPKTVTSEHHYPVSSFLCNCGDCWPHRKKPGDA